MKCLYLQFQFLSYKLIFVIKESCPLLTNPLSVPHTQLPEFCVEHCERLWEQAITIEDYDGPYDQYRVFNPEACQHDGEVRYSHDSLVVITTTLRNYVIVEECVLCDEDSGEQGFKFICQYGGE